MEQKNNNSGIGSDIDPPYVNDNSNKKNHWGLGIEHEFLPVIKIKSGNDAVKIVKDLYHLENKNEKNTFSNEELKHLENIKEVIDKLLLANKPIYFYCNFTVNFDKYDTEYPFSNIEYTGTNGFYMIETKNLDFQNKKLDQVYEELKKNTDKIMLDLNEIIKKDSKLDLNFSIPNEGSIMFLTNPTQKKGFEFKSIFGIYECNIDKYKVFTDTSGSYHFWMTLPYNNSETEENIIINHQKACYLLQTIEPLLVAVYGSPDPRYQSNNTNKKYFAGTYRGAVNRFANYGSSQINKYSEYELYTRTKDSSKIVKPTSINSEHYITKIRNRYKKQIPSTIKKSNLINEDELQNNSTSMINQDKAPNYIYFNKEWNMFDNGKTPLLDLYHMFYKGIENIESPWIGLNIRRKPNVKGFEFRIMDHLPEEEVYDVFKVILLVSCLSYEIDHTHLLLASSNNGWNDAMANALMYGSMKQVGKEYLDFISSQFKIPSDIFKNNSPITILETLIGTLWNIISKNKSNGYWLMCDDKKPIIKSKNKEILDKLLSKNKTKKTNKQKTKKTKKTKKNKTKTKTNK
jgi:hypothetical protein